MAQQIVRIVLQAVDQASSVIKKTEAEVVGFGDKAKSAFGELKTALSSRIFQGATLVALGAALRKGWEESDNLEASMRKLGGTAKLTGTPLEFLTKIAQDAKQAFGLSTVQSNEFASALARLAGRADRLDETGEALRGLLDVAAARGLNAEQALVAINQAILGIDEGTDKLFDKNPSFIYQEWADRAGKAAGKLTDTEKAQALLDEVLRGGEVTRGSYAEFLETAAGRSQQLANRTQDAAAEFGNATASLRDLLLPAATVAAEGLSGLIKVVQSIGAVVGTVFYGATEAIVGFASVVFEVIQGDFKGAFESGKKTLQNFKDLASGTAMNLEEIWKGSNTAITTDLDLHLTNRGTRQKEAGEDAEKLAKEQATELTKINDELAAKVLQIEHGLTEAQAKEMVRRARLLTGEQANMVKSLGEGYKQLDQFNLLLAAGFDKQVTPAVKRAEVSLVGIRDTSKTVFPQAKDAVGNFKREAEGLDPVFRDASKAISEAGQALDVLGEQAGEALVDAINLADAMKRVAGGDPTAIIGVVANLGGLLGSLFGDNPAAAARERILKENNDRLRDLARITGDLVDAQTSGAAFGAIRDALTPIGARSFLATNAKNRTLTDGELGTLRGELLNRGISFSDLDQAAKDLGIKIRDDDGNLLTGGLAKLRQAIFGADTGAPNTFAGRLSTVDTGLDIGAIGAGGEFGALLGAAGDNAITRLFRDLDVTTSEGRSAGISALQSLFGEFAGGRLGIEDFGDLNRGEFERLIVRLVGILQSDTEIDAFTPPGLPLGPGDVPDVAFSLTAGFDALQDPLAAQTDYLAESVSLLGSINDALTKPMDIAAGGGSARAFGTTLVNPVFQFHGGAVGDPAAVQGHVVDLFAQMDRYLGRRFDQERDNRGSAARV